MQQFKYEWNIEKVMWTRIWRAILSSQKEYSDILSFLSLVVGMEQRQNIFYSFWPYFTKEVGLFQRVDGILPAPWVNVGQCDQGQGQAFTGKYIDVHHFLKKICLLF